MLFRHLYSNLKHRIHFVGALVELERGGFLPRGGGGLEHYGSQACMAVPITACRPAPALSTTAIIAAPCTLQICTDDGTHSPLHAC